ncbi:MAG: hypothetical protein H6721_30995 [Sandaracinus sp.]|nr:hypothetical protein [Sandaracinus sp.]MCB9622396.1 hypothetical protein [Sandaracinus sp.]MCB9636560.1 hypothetical protein [Sandaracinus sp.]
MVRSGTWVAAWLVFGTGCFVGSVDLEGRPCPCASGWRCDEARNVCVRGESDGGTRDGGRDAGVDARPVDASRVDASDASDASSDSSVDGSTEPDAAVDAGTDAGVDAGIDGGIDAGIDAGPPPGLLFAEDFEGGGFVRWDYRDEMMANLTVITNAASAHGGSRYLRARTDMAGGRGALGVALPRTFTSGELWIRVYIRVPAASTFTIGASITAVGTGVAPAYHSMSLQLSGAFVSMYSSPTNLYVEGTEPFARDRWQCLLGHVVINDTTGLFEAWLDGTRSLRRTNTDTRDVNPWAVIELGIPYTDPGQAPTEVHLDDYMIAEAPLACP